MSFNNKVVIVTGSSSGIGAATAIIFAREGANVVVTGRNEANLNSVAEQCGKVGKKALIIKADIGKENEAATVITKTIEKFGKLDVLVNNAAIFKVIPILDKNVISIFDDTINTNLRSVVVLTHLALPHLEKTKGNIVNISSVAASQHMVGFSVYATSKAALNHFSKVAAKEFSAKGVRVNIVSPGPVETPIFENSGADISWEFLRSKTALQKISKPEEIGELISYVASDKAGSVTGANFVIDCGALVN